MLRGRLIGAYAVLVLACAMDAAAFDTSRIGDPEVRDCVDRALPTNSARQTQELEAIGKDGYARLTVREVLWRRENERDSRIVVRTLEPLEERGVSVLVIDNDERNEASYQAYSPRIKRVRRSTGDAVFSTIIASDFTYDDFSYFYRRDAQEQVERRDDIELDGHATYVLETVKPRDKSEYKLVRFFIDQAVCVPMRTEFIAHNGELRKELLADRATLREVGPRWVPYEATMMDHKLGTRSIYRVRDIELDPALDDSLFEAGALMRGAN